MSDPASDKNVVAFEGHSDRQFAAELASEVRAKLAEIAVKMDEANRRGLRVEFNMGVDAFGRNVVMRLDVVRSML